jgi:hypothetical protein
MRETSTLKFVGGPSEDLVINLPTSLHILVMDSTPREKRTENCRARMYVCNARTGERDEVAMLREDSGTWFVRRLYGELRDATNRVFRYYDRALPQTGKERIISR